MGWRENETVAAFIAAVRRFTVTFVHHGVLQRDQLIGCYGNHIVHYRGCKHKLLVGGCVLGDISSTLHVPQDQRELLTKCLGRT